MGGLRRLTQASNPQQPQGARSSAADASLAGLGRPGHHQLSAGMTHAQALLQSALEELELVRREEERRLAQVVAALRRGYGARMQALERRLLAEAEALQNRLQESIEREAQRSQVAVDAKAHELLGALERAGSGPGGLACNPSKAAGARSIGTHSHSQAVLGPPLPLAQHCSRQETAPALRTSPTQAMGAPGWAIAALQLPFAMPAVALKSGSPAISSCHTAAAAAARPVKAHKQSTNALSRIDVMPRSLGLQQLVPPAEANTAASMHASLPHSSLGQPSGSTPLQGRRSSVSFVPGAGSIRGGTCSASPQGGATPLPAGVPGSRAPAPAAVAQARRAAGAQGPLCTQNRQLAHVSSSEFEDYSYLGPRCSGRPT
ncbi:hypothetical protein ABPG77_002168 [Micractinium sp. CCAP 211/92]